jgi:hypothetical protein
MRPRLGPSGGIGAPDVRPYGGQLTPCRGLRSRCGGLSLTREQSKQLKVGHRVSWHDSPTDQGTVLATDWSGVQIEWDNGKTQFFHHNNMTEVSNAPLR